MGGKINTAGVYHIDLTYYQGSRWASPMSPFAIFNFI
jgi:hypothetical protein